MSNKHRNLSAVFARVENLLRFEVRWIEIDFGLAKDGAFASHHVVAIDGCWRSEPGKCVKRFFIFRFASEACRCAQPGKLNLANKLSVGVVNLYLSVRVLQVVCYEHVVMQEHYERFLIPHQEFQLEALAYDAIR